MTPNQQEALDFIRERIDVAQLSPTLEEIANRVRVSRAGAWKIVGALEEQGYLRRRTGKRRGIELAGRVDLRAVGTNAILAELARRGVTTGALTRPERRAFRRGDVTCAADCCDIVVKRGHAFCLGHWRSISPGTQRALLASHRQAVDSGDPVDATRYQEVFGRARDEASSCGGPF